MAQIFIENHNQVITCNPGLNLLNNFLINDIPIHTVCGGKAMCGCCRIKIISGMEGINKVNQAETSRLGEELIKDGWRLACQSFCLRDITVHVPTSQELDDLCSQT